MQITLLFSLLLLIELVISSQPYYSKIKNRLIDKDVTKLKRSFQFLLIPRGGDDVIEQNPNYEGPNNDSVPSESRKRRKKESKSALVEEEVEEDKKELIFIGKSMKLSHESTKRILVGLLAIIVILWFKLMWTEKSIPASGSVRSIWKIMTLSPSEILKFIIFLDVMRKIFYPLLLGDGGSTYIPPTHQTLTFERIHLRHHRNALAFDRALTTPENYPSISNPKDLFHLVKKRWTETRIEKPSRTVSNNHTVIVLEFKDIPSSPNPHHKLQYQLTLLKHSVEFLLQHPPKNDSFELAVLISSQGGPVSEYGLASSYLSLLRSVYNVTVFVDTCAASGGYMMACQAHTVYASPFALLGSIGVLAQSINFYQILKKYGIYNHVFTAGKNKAPISPIGPITDENEECIQRLINRIHASFVNAVIESPRRSQIFSSRKEVFEGDVYLGKEAMDLGLIDGIQTSGEFLNKQMQSGSRVLKIVKLEERGPARFLFGNSRLDGASMSTIFSQIWKNTLRLFFPNYF